MQPCLAPFLSPTRSHQVSSSYVLVFECQLCTAMQRCLLEFPASSKLCEHQLQLWAVVLPPSSPSILCLYFFSLLWSVVAVCPMAVGRAV